MESFVAVLGVITACLAGMLLAIRLVPQWRKTQSDFLALMDGATAFVALLAVSIGALGTDLFGTLQSVGGTLLLGFVFSGLIYGLAWVVITARRGRKPPAPEDEI